jgi:hypothetical protein
MGFTPVMTDVNAAEIEVDTTPSINYPPTIIEDLPQQAEI